MAFSTDELMLAHQHSTLFSNIPYLVTCLQKDKMVKTSIESKKLVDHRLYLLA